MDIREDPVKTVRNLCDRLTVIEGTMQQIANTKGKGKDCALYKEYQEAHERVVDLLRQHIKT